MKTQTLRKAIREEVRKALTEAKSPFYELGWNIGPNKKDDVDESSKEAKYVMDKAKQFYDSGLAVKAIASDKNLTDFAKGYIESHAVSGMKFQGLTDVVKTLILLGRTGWPKTIYSTYK